MALNIKNPEVEKLAAEVARMAMESKTEAIRKALIERKARLEDQKASFETRAERLQRFLETEVWPLIPESERGRRLTKDEEEEILGIGPEGY